MWSKAPDFEEVLQTYSRLGAVKAEIKALQATIDIDGNEIKKNAPRKPYLLVERFEVEYRQIAALEAEKETLEYKIKFLEYRKDMYISDGYRNR